MGWSDFSMVKGKTLQCRTESQGFRLNESVAELSLPHPRMSPLLSSRALARGWTQEDLLALPAGRSMKHPRPGPGGSPPPLPPAVASHGSPKAPQAFREPPTSLPASLRQKGPLKHGSARKKGNCFFAQNVCVFFLSLALLILPFTPCRF